MPLAIESTVTISSTIATASATALAASAFAARPSILWGVAVVVGIFVLLRSVTSLMWPADPRARVNSAVRGRDGCSEFVERNLSLRLLRFRPIDARPQGAYRLGLRVFLLGEKVSFTDAAAGDVFMTDVFAVSDGSTVELGAVVQCQVQLPAHPAASNTEPSLRAEISLYFEDETNHSGQGRFEEVGAEVLLLRCAEDGLSACCAVIFDEVKHFGVLELQALIAPLGTIMQEIAVSGQEVALPCAFPHGWSLRGMGTAPSRLYQRAAARAQQAFDCGASSDEGMLAPPLPELVISKSQASNDFRGSVEIEELPSMSGWAGPVILFEDTCGAQECKTKTGPTPADGADNTEEQSVGKTGIHLVVVVPDVGGSALDVRPLRNHFAAALPQAVMFVFSDADGAAPAGSGVRRRRMPGGADVLQRRGVALAEEVSEQIKTLPQPGLARLSFVAVSCGGLVVRASLPWLRSYSNSFWTLVTIGTPHLGRFPRHNYLKAALYGLARAWPVGAKLPCAWQLALEDGRAPEESYVYKLSREPCLERFRAVILAGSLRDWRAPPDKALVEERKVGPTEKRSLSNPACVDVCTPAGRRWWYLWWWWFRWFDISDFDGMMAQRMLAAGPGPSPVVRPLLLLRIRAVAPWISVPWASEANRLIRSRHFLRTFVRRYSVLLQ